jgi:hypothetical protein
MIFKDDGSIWFRQSWLDTAFRCPEEGRLAIIKPEWEAISSDEAIIGTGAHYGIEQVIRGAITTDQIGETSYKYAAKIIADEGVRWTKRKSVEEVGDYAARCAEAWVTDIMPIAPIEGARSEVSFSVPLFEHRGRQVGVQGTVDLVPTIPELWDWKTAGSEYKQRDKQKWAIQPTIYALAAVKGGLQSEVKFTWPVEFTYGVMIKRVGQCRGQILTVQRTQAHANWAMYRMRTLVDLALDFGLDKPWPQIDESNYLCSNTWCAFYSICRGAEITPSLDYWS